MPTTSAGLLFLGRGSTLDRCHMSQRPSTTSSWLCIGAVMVRLRWPSSGLWMISAFIQWRMFISYICVLTLDRRLEEAWFGGWSP